jgi:acetyltransferase-like isoleucine patch superfamily enzyme
MNFINKIRILGGVSGIVLLVWDRVSFRLYKKRYYKNIFLNYGENIRWGKHSLRLTIPESVRIANPQKISISNNCEFDEYVYLQSHHDGEGLVIGNGVRINAFTHVQAFSKVIIEDSVLIAPFSHVNSGNHGMHDNSCPIMNQPYEKAGMITIGMGTWLGRSSHILGGVVLGKNCVVAAGAVVTKSFSDFSIVGGVPAKLLKAIDETKN